MSSWNKIAKCVVTLAIGIALTLVAPLAASAQQPSWTAFSESGGSANGAQTVYRLSYMSLDRRWHFGLSCGILEPVAQNAPSTITIDAIFNGASNSGAGAVHALEFSADNLTLAVDATITQQNVAGDHHFFSATTDYRQPFFQAMATANTLRFNVQGESQIALTLDNGRSAVNEYLNNCVAGTQPASPQAPVAQVAQVAAPTAPAPSSNGNATAEGIALGILGLGAAIIANEIAEEIFSSSTNNPQSNVPVGVAVAPGQGELNVTIIQIRAQQTTGGFGDDDLFLTFSNGTRLPAGSSASHAIGRGEIWSPNHVANASGGLEISLWEYDTLNADDFIGAFVVGAALSDGRYTQSVIGDGATYDVTFEVRRNFAAQQPARQPTQQTFSPPTTRRAWSAYGSGDTVTATDCTTDCEEDIGILFICQGYGQPAEVHVPWVSFENGSAGAVLPLDIAVGSQRFSYSAAVQGPGLVGYYPTFMVNPNDPMIEALQAGSSVRIDFAGQSTQIGLRGSRVALDQFRQQCGWNNVASGPSAPVEQEAQPFWFTSQYDDFDTGQLAHALTFGIPETDAVGFSATCQPAVGDGFVAVDMLVDFGNQPNGTPATTFIQVGSTTFPFSGQVFQSSSEWAGVETRIAVGDPVWQAMQSEPSQISYGMFGGGTNAASMRGASSAIAQFLAACNKPQNGSATTKLPDQPQGAPSQLSYTCDDGSGLTLGLSEVGGARVASIVQSSGDEFALIEVPTQVGTKYSNGEATLSARGTIIHFSAPYVAIFCEVN